MKNSFSYIRITVAALLAAFLISCPAVNGSNGGEEQQQTVEVAAGLRGKVLILQAYGTGSNTDGGVSHSFIELYNKSGQEADLSGHYLQYSTGGNNWSALSLDGKKIPAGHSFLVMGKKMNEHRPANGYGLLQLDTENADLLWEDGAALLQMNNNRFKIFLVESESPVRVTNPFDFNNDRSGVKAPGYVDLLGTNDTDKTHNIDAFESPNIQNVSLRAAYMSSKGKSVRRVDLYDTDDNIRDFNSVEWRSGRNDSISADEFDAYRPRSVKDGAWMPFAGSGLDIISLLIAGQEADPGTAADSYSSVISPGAVTISSLLASVPVDLVVASGATFRTAIASGNAAPQWRDDPSPAYSFSNGDFLYIEVKRADSRSARIYKIKVTVRAVSATVTLSGTYELNLNSTYAQQRVVVEAYSSQAAATLISSVEASQSNKTWTMQVPLGQALWFRVAVTDSTGYRFGRVVSKSAQSFASSAAGINLVLGPFDPPEIIAFTLLGATASSNAVGNKSGIIEQDAIRFANTSYTTLNRTMVLNFHSLAAYFALSEGSKLYVGDVEQVSSVTTNNYYNDVVFTVIAEDNARKTYTVAGQNLDVNSSASGANNDGASNRVVGTRSWQTQGFGVMIIDTTEKTVGFPVGVTSAINMGVWNTTGTFTYIGPTGRVITGGTDIRGRGNYSMRVETTKSYNLRLNSAAGFDYYDYKTKAYQTLPSHRRWALLAHSNDSSRIKTTLGWELGRRVFTKMGWQPHGDWVFFFLNGTYQGMYIFCEVIKPEEGRLGITPLISSSNPTGGFATEINNHYFYYNEGEAHSSLNGNYTFDEMYSFVTSHQNPVNGRQRGVAWTMNEPDSNLGWYFPDPPGGDGKTLTFTNPAHAEYFPRKGITFMATLGAGTEYNRKSNPPGQWIVPNDIGQPNGIGTSTMLRSGTFTQTNGNYHGTGGGINSERTLADAFPAYASSTIVQIAQFLQNAEDAVYSHDWTEKGYGKGSYLDYLDIDSFIDWQFAMEMCSNWEVNIQNGQHAHFDPKIGKLKMGPIWDLDNAWSRGSNGSDAGFIRKTGLWYKELLGWEITSSTSNYSVESGRERADRKDPYYVAQLKARWSAVYPQLAAGGELDQYIDAANARFSRVTGFNNSSNSSPAGSPVAINGNRTTMKGTISDMRSRLNTEFANY